MKQVVMNSHHNSIKMAKNVFTCHYIQTYHINKVSVGMMLSHSVSLSREGPDGLFPLD